MSVDRDKTFVALLLDLSKAFDRLDHALLIGKLRVDSWATFI